MYRLLGFTLVLFATLTFGAAKNLAQAKYASIILDAETGEVFHSVNADTRNHPASLTKIMTLYMLFDAVEKGDLKLTSKLKVSRKASQQRPSKLGLRKGTTITVEDAILALVTKSANDVAVVVAEGIGGTEAKFAKAMTQKAHAMGMKNTFFKNASGLHKRGQLSSARDMATLGLRIRSDFPQFYHYFSTWKYKYKNRTYYNHNKLLRYYEGTDGIKTGFTNASGFNLVASVERHGRRLLGVVFGGRTSKSRNAHMQKLLNKSYHKILIASLRPPMKPEIKLADNGKVVILERETQIALADDVNGEYLKSKPQKEAETVKLVTSETLTKELDQPVQVAATNQKPSTSSKKTEPVLEAETIWAVQVGAFREKRRAHQAAGLAAVHVRYVSKDANIQVSEVKDLKNRLYRARLTGLSEMEARESCHVLTETSLSCVIIPPIQPDQIAIVN
ncbi:D-alanyl-D-alanine carboxypeptidase family protein [Curvivirga sp.]|uniref:D-alanyl-D-alanine carboxypeptidase family protein n=1 Tax=Curvivirga sp. TaxID=2856848 RepID=UPI003B5C957E